MEHQLYKAIVAILTALDNRPMSTRFTYRDRRIAEVYYWAVIHDRPVAWACCRVNWPPHLRRQPLPSESRMSRRLRSPAVIALLTALEQRIIAPKEPGLFWVIDGKPRVIGGCSKDRQAGYGRAAAGKAKGYKLHALVGASGIAAGRVAPMNKDERVMAARLLRQAALPALGSAWPFPSCCSVSCLYCAAGCQSPARGWLDFAEFSRFRCSLRRWVSLGSWGARLVSMP